MSVKEGPEAVKIPARFESEVLSCSGCKFLSHTLVKSGANPIYTNNCNNSAATARRFLDFTSNLEIDDNYLIIPGDFCPFKK